MHVGEEARMYDGKQQFCLGNLHRKMIAEAVAALLGPVLISMAHSDGHLFYTSVPGKCDNVWWFQIFTCSDSTLLEDKAN